MTKDTIHQIEGNAEFVDSKTVKVNDEMYTAKNILIAVGSSAWIPNVPGAQEYGMTSDGFFELEYLPKKVAIVGAGYIAVELAGIFASLGSEVSIFVRGDSYLRSFDDIIQTTVMDEYKKIGIKTVTHANITKVVNSGTKDAKSLSLHCSNADEDFGGKLSFSLIYSTGFEELIYAVGRHANLKNLSIISFLTI
jgi:glutathione reductase (NADPH)